MKSRFLSVCPTSDLQLSPGVTHSVMGRASINPEERSYVGWLVPRDGLPEVAVLPAVTRLDDQGDVKMEIVSQGRESATIRQGAPVAFFFVPGHDLMTSSNLKLAHMLDTLEKRLVFFLIQFECGSNPLKAEDVELIDW